MTAILQELAKGAQTPLGFASFALVLILIGVVKFWPLARHTLLAGIAMTAAVIVLVAGLGMAYLMVRPTVPTPQASPIVPALPPSTGAQSPSPGQSCLITSTGNVIVNTGSGIAADGVCSHAN
jgi:hypothetical protein